MLKRAKIHIFTVLASIVTLAAASCDRSVIFDYAGDCEVHHIVRFRYDMNLKWADAFASEVKSVHLYVFDSDGLFLQEYSDRGPALSTGDYFIELKNLPAGDYKFVAWCGLDNDTDDESFTVPQPVAGRTTIEELTCSLNTLGKSRSSLSSDKRLYFLYHGYLEDTLIDDNDGETFEHVIYLTKDTNHIRIILQELSTDEDMDPDDYEIFIESANGVMAYDNSMLGTDVITYQPWALDNDVVEIGKPDVSETVYVKGVYADLSLARLMNSENRSLMLTILDSKHKGQVIARVPLIQYALLSRRYYEEAYGHKMSDQEFLDREDEYVFTFFLYGNRWVNTYINIHSWRVVLHNYDVDSGM